MELKSWSLKFALSLAVAAALWVGAVSLTNALLHGRQASHAVSQGGMQ
jgi:hypothetical protein